MGERIRLQVGPAPAHAARAWIENRRQFVSAARRAVAANPDALDLLEMFLDLWADESMAGDTFDWHTELDIDVLVLTARYWLDLGEMSHDARAAIGVPHPPPEAEQFTAVVASGMVDALRAAGPAGQPLLARLGL